MKSNFKSDLAKAYEAKEFESGIYQAWEKSGFFNPDKLPGAGKPFVISMPPPNATGVLHLGHAAALTYEDILIRFKRLRGYKTLWLPGTDHAAIATQTRVEKILAKEGTDRYKLGREKFLERVRKFVVESRQTIKEQTRRMGSSCDWSRERYTFDEGLSRAVSEAFVRMYKDGLIYRGSRIVNWCPRCASTLADDEVEYKEADSKLYYIKYGPFVVATTRPETKLADTGVAVNPQDKRYKKYVGKILEINLAGHKVKVKVFADKIVDQNFGSGVVGVTPAHSATDFAFAQKHKLEIIKLIDEQGKLLASGGKYQGLDVAAARTSFVKDLKKNGQLIKIEDFKNNLSFCYRCGTPLEPLVSEQWFVAVDKKIPGRKKSLKELAVQAVKSGEIKILPSQFSKVYFHWMNNLHDWCISRQIWWGHRIPVWYGQAGEVIVAANEVEAKKIAHGKKITQDADTLDTWFSSALWTFSTLGWPRQTSDLMKFHPTSVMETGYDIIFFWVARMILMTEYILAEKPFETVYLHGMIRDKEGRKMSKSLGNGIDPIEMIDKFGADALRLSLVIGSASGADLRLYEEKIAGYRNFVNKLWNISRFILANVHNVKTIKTRPKGKTLSDRWILAELDCLIFEVTADLDNYKFSAAGENLYDFSWAKLADWYLEIAKIEKNKDDILLYILERLLILWHPFTPYVTEVIWRQFPSKQMLLVSSWPTAKKNDKKILAAFRELQELVMKIRNLKTENNIAPVELPDCVLVSKLLNKNDLQVVAKLARVNLVTTITKAKIFKTAHSHGQINLARAISVREKENLEKYINSLETQLANKKFVASAPANIIEQTKEKLKNAKAKLL
ncbi:MAG: valine--tRNA ligase [Parcubacteria group bacterium]|nr:MAG: valine--tRNA ligase [Parcubacteria group bacterium]